MKILMLTDVNSAHSFKWISSLAGDDTEIHVFSLTPDKGLFSGMKNVMVTSFNLTKSEGEPGKITYLKALPRLKKLIRQIKPDILHAHYASSYGLLGALTGFKPFVISVWGSDVYDFPNKSFIHRKILKYNLKKATAILSTGHNMAKEISKYTNKEIQVISFGIDTNVFKPIKNEIEKESIVIGTVKTLEKIYGINYLIEAFSLAFAQNPDKNLKLLIVGGGSEMQNLKETAKNLSVSDNIEFTGPVGYSEVPLYHNKIDIFVAVSLQESFGVAVLEASSCEKPVVVSNVGGLPEIVENGVTGIIVPPESVEKTAEALNTLICNENLRKELGKNGRNRVIELYSWNKCVEKMKNIYTDLLLKA
ncbi:MAG: glycosyl transferase family 1 [Bacteroidetes bacterium GWF2_38_335]|nr:MAG: glycosyl transferase family 1 [Bacteroidetes bacterium GWF2_38_335]HBS88017.1 glycosyltransferase family 4 protein [Bacteroidales bacterium]